MTKHCPIKQTINIKDMSNMSRDVIFAEKENGAPISSNELREGVRVGYRAGLGYRGAPSNTHNCFKCPDLILLGSV